MHKFEKEEIDRRARLITLSHELENLFKEKKKNLVVDWKSIFNKGHISEVEELYNRTIQVVEKQISILEDIFKLILDEEKTIQDMKNEFGIHTNYAELVKSHFKFADEKGELISREDMDTERIKQLILALKEDLQIQHKILKESEGLGRKAYSEIDVIKLVKKEFEMLKGIQPFWHDWEVTADRLNHLISDKDGIKAHEWDEVKKEIENLLGVYHENFSDKGSAPQIGTELAITLYMNKTREIQKMGGVIPISVVNIDLVACNKIDESHKLGNALIDLGYQELKKLLGRDFSREHEETITGNGVVTILGRTRYKIVGVPKHEIEEALKKVPKKIIPHVKKLAKKISSNSKNEEIQQIIEGIEGRMYAGYSELNISEDFLDRIKKTIEHIRENTNTDTQSEHVHAFYHEAIRQFEERIAKDIVNTTKRSAAQAEYLEKVIIGSVRDKIEYEVFQEKEKRGIPVSTSREDLLTEYSIRRSIESKYIFQLIYSGDPKGFMGRNYVPEDEYQGRMVERISHQIGLDRMLLKELDEFVKNSKQGNVSTDELKAAKDKFIIDVLQKRFLSSVYDIRYKNSLKEGAYDLALATAQYLEGAQIWTFFEIDGFKAFNTVYLPDSEDTYYHALFDEILNQFDNTINKGKSGSEKIVPRITKQGDEIWFSYPRKFGGMNISKKDHENFLKNFQKRLNSRSEQSDSLFVPNKHTNEWVHYLILNYEEARWHIDNAISLGKKITYVDNKIYEANFNNKKAVKEDQIPVIDDGNLNFYKSDNFLKQALKVNEDEIDFSGWRSLSGCCQINSGKYAKDKFQYSLMLFPELVKQLRGSTSFRFITGRVIRLGTTIGYVGFGDDVVIVETPEDVNRLRSQLNQSVEKIREKKGRGVIAEIRLSELKDKKS
ncbi:hypothetical protein HQ545_08895 [Candidatus Woesearchaeota archaeon]|nr:hypothetical protein [Candidatus Woesearchaeota archaeon]